MAAPRLAGLTATNDLAPGIITRGQATGVLMPEHDAAPDVILIVGQSNASGNGHPIRPQLTGSDHLVQWWHTGQDPRRGTVTGVQEPVSRAYDGSAGTSPGVAFARHWAAWHRRPTIVVPAAWGGTGLISAGARWQETGDLYKAAVREAGDCIAATGGRLAAILWCQGENDAVSGVSNSPTDGYAVVAARVLAKLRTDLAAPNAVVAVGGMVPDWVTLGQGTATAIQDALASLPSKLTRCVYAVGGYGTGAETDGIHYDARGVQQLADGLWGAYRRLETPALPPVRPPAPGVVATATGVRVSLVPVSGATSHEVRWRTDGTWATASVASMAASITAGTGTLVEVQTRAVGPTGTSAWSGSSYGAPVLATARLLLDPSGPGTPHRAPVTVAGAGRTVGQPTAGQQPVMDREDGIADAAAMRFDGTDWLGGPALAATDLGDTNGRFTVVALVQADAAHDGSFFGWRSDALSIMNIGMDAGEIIAQAFDASGAVLAARTSGVDSTRPHLVIVDRWQAGVTLTVDGVETVASGGAPVTSGTVPLVVGAAYRANASAQSIQLWRGRIAFLCVLPAAASAAEKTAISAYVRARANL